MCDNTLYDEWYNAITIKFVPCIRLVYIVIEAGNSLAYINSGVEESRSTDTYNKEIYGAQDVNTMFNEILLEV